MAGRWEASFAPEMIVEHPVYHLNVFGVNTVLDGAEAVQAVHAEWARTGQNFFYMADEKLAAGDNVVVSTATIYQQTPGAVLGYRDAAGWPRIGLEGTLGEGAGFGPAQTAFLGRAPFAVVASWDGEGRADASPKGDPPGVIRPIGLTTVAIADRPGNRRTYTFHNLLESPEVALAARAVRSLSREPPLRSGLDLDYRKNLY